MSYAALGVAPSANVQAALDMLPKCHSHRFDACWHCDPKDLQCQDQSKYPHCRYIQQAWSADRDTMDAAVDALPFCPAPRSPLVTGAAAVGLVLLGAAVGTALARS